MQAERIVLKLLGRGFAALTRSSFAGSTAPELDGWIPSQKDIRLFGSGKTHSECAQQNRQRMQSKTASKAPPRRFPEKANKFDGLARLGQDPVRSLISAFGPSRRLYVGQTQDARTAAAPKGILAEGDRISSLSRRAQS